MGSIREQASRRLGEILVERLGELEPADLLAVFLAARRKIAIRFGADARQLPGLDAAGLLGLIERSTAALEATEGSGSRLARWVVLDEGDCGRWPRWRLHCSLCGWEGWRSVDRTPRRCPCCNAVAVLDGDPLAVLAAAG